MRAGEDVILAAKLMLGRVTGADGAGVVEIEHALRRVAGGEADHADAAVALIIARRLGDPPARIEREGHRQPALPVAVIVELGAVGAGGAAAAIGGAGARTEERRAG